MHRAPRWLVAVLGAMLLLCAFGLVRELTAATPHRPLLLSYSFYTLLALAALVETLLSTVRIEDGAVRVRGIFRSLLVPLDEIDYVKLEGRGVQLRLKSGDWRKLPPPDWIRASPAARRRIAEAIEAATGRGPSP